MINHVNVVPRVSYIKFHSMMSQLIKNKGLPVRNMVPDFATVESDPKWHIENSPLDQV